MQIVNCFATVIGEKMLPEALEAEKAKYLTTPWVKPSQMVEYYPYATSPSQSGINARIEKRYRFYHYIPTNRT